MAREKGMDIARAKNEVKRVPTRKGKAANLLKTGSHVLPNRNFKPKTLIEGKELITNVTKIERIKINTNIPEIWRVFLNRDSRFLLERIVECRLLFGKGIFVLL